MSPLQFLTVKVVSHSIHKALKHLRQKYIYTCDICNLISRETGKLFKKLDSINKQTEFENVFIIFHCFGKLESGQETNKRQHLRALTRNIVAAKMETRLIVEMFLFWLLSTKGPLNTHSFQYMHIF